MDISRITHGLIIDQPWIDMILTGHKSWEMRTTASYRRGPIALVRKGSKQVVGIAELVDSKGPLSIKELSDTFDRHCIPPEVFNRDDYKWFYAWQLASVCPLTTPVDYLHKSGSVIWVELDEECKRALSNANPDLAAKEGLPAAIRTNDQPEVRGIASFLLPVARDGSVFCPTECSRNGVYTVGDKGDEKRFTDFHDALSYLRTMPTARWRRPNANGNWGIVSAVDWID